MRPIKETVDDFRVVSYVQNDARTFDNEVVNALAENSGPDILFLPHEKLLQYRSKLQPFPVGELDIPDFRRSFIDGTEIFVLSDGIYAYPLQLIHW